MGHTMATWRLLEDMMLALKKAGVEIPTKIIEDLRASKSMIKLACSEGSHGDAIMKAEELQANVEAYLVTEAQKTFGSERVDEWLMQLEQATSEVCEEPPEENVFVTGVPRDQKWVRVEPHDDLTAERIEQMAKAHGLQIKLQSDGKLLVHGQISEIKDLIRKMTAATKEKFV
ncbi:MAG: DUF2096 domain-containing protein [Candidatus Bathyarchaeota archaeon]|nr:DUF2096 domain-containing protein [Candidatus Bathyarchaeota archaeon]